MGVAGPGESIALPELGGALPVGAAYARVAF
jgi:hypothetical protein